MKNPYLEFQISIGVILFLSTAAAHAGIAMIIMPFLAGIFMPHGISFLITMFLMEHSVSINDFVAERNKTPPKKLHNYRNEAKLHLEITPSHQIAPKKTQDESINPLANDSVSTDPVFSPPTPSSTSYSAAISQDKNILSIAKPLKTQIALGSSEYAINHNSLLNHRNTTPNMFSYPINEPLKIALENAVRNPNYLTQTSTKIRKEIVKRPLMFANSIKKVEKAKGAIISAVIRSNSPLVNASKPVFRQLLPSSIPQNNSNVINAILSVDAAKPKPPMRQIPIIANEANVDLFDQPLDIPLAQEFFAGVPEAAPPAENDVLVPPINEAPRNEVLPANNAQVVEPNEADQRAALNLLALSHSFSSAAASSMMDEDDLDKNNPTLTQSHFNTRPNANPPGGLQIDLLPGNQSTTEQTTNDNSPDSIETDDEQMASALLKLNNSPSTRDESSTIESNSTDNEVETVDPNNTIDSNDLFISSILLDLHNSFNNSEVPVKEVLPRVENTNHAVTSSKPQSELRTSEDSSSNNIEELASSIAVDNELYEQFKELDSQDVEDEHIKFQQNEALQGDSKAEPAINSADLNAPIMNSLSGDTILTSSLEHLALSVTGHLEYGLNGTPRSGLPRIITITNKGQFHTENLLISMPIWPAGTVSSTTCGNILEAGAECTITIKPGNNATSDGNYSCSEGRYPLPAVIKIVADNAAPRLVNVVVLDYGCIYQGGLVYALDDSIPNTKSVGGKVVSLTDLIPDGLKGVGFDSSHPGVDEEWMLVEGGNSEPVYQQRPFNAADSCEQAIAGYRDWYLPQICEMGYGSDLCGTAAAPKMQNIQSNLVDFHNLNLLSGTYWSATETNDYPFMTAWYQKFAKNNDSYQMLTYKNVLLNVRCSRAFR